MCCFLVNRGILTPAVESLAERVRRMIENYPCIHPAITCAASLAHHGLLGSLRDVRLVDVDLTSIPAEHLASLVSSVTGCVTIKNVSGCNLVSILNSASVKSKELDFGRYQSLGSEETQALVQAMESRVESVGLGGEVTLDIKILMEYSGQGKCMQVWCAIDTANRYREQLRNWTTSRNWEVTRNNDYYFIIEGPHHNS